MEEITALLAEKAELEGKLEANKKALDAISRRKMKALSQSEHRFGDPVYVYCSGEKILLADGGWTGTVLMPVFYQTPDQKGKVGWTQSQYQGWAVLSKEEAERSGIPVYDGRRKMSVDQSRD